MRAQNLIKLCRFGESGNNQLLMIKDECTKLAEAVTCETATAKIISNHLGATVIRDPLCNRDFGIRLWKNLRWKPTEGIDEMIAKNRRKLLKRPHQELTKGRDKNVYCSRYD